MDDSVLLLPMGMDLDNYNPFMDEPPPIITDTDFQMQQNIDFILSCSPIRIDISADDESSISCSSGCITSSEETVDEKTAAVIVPRVERRGRPRLGTNPKPKPKPVAPMIVRNATMLLKSKTAEPDKWNKSPFLHFAFPENTKK